MNIYNENKQRRKRNIYRIKLGITGLMDNPVLNAIWIPAILLIIIFEYFKKIYISAITVPKILSNMFFIAEKIITILIPVMIAFSIVYLIGELIARNDENNLLLAFDEKDLKKGIPLLISKKKNDRVTTREFYTNIPISKWNERKNDIAHVMNITIIGEIEYSKKNYIKFKSVIGRAPKKSKLLYDDI